MDYSKELSDALVTLGFEQVPASAISEVELPSDLSDAYVKVAPNGKLIVTPFDEAMIGSPAKLYFVSQNGVESKFITLGDLASSVSELCGYSEDEEQKEGKTVIESEDEEENKEAEDEGKSVVDKYASVDAGPIIDRVNLYSKLHPENDYTEILTLLQGAKNMPQIEEIQKEHELIFPKMLVTGTSHSDIVQSELDKIYDPTPVGTQILPPVGSDKAPELESKVKELESELESENAKNSELASALVRLGERIASLTERMALIVSKLCKESSDTQEPLGKPEVIVPNTTNLMGYGAQLKAITSAALKEGI